MVQRKKNILFLCSWYPCRVHPDNGNFIERHIECLGDAIEKSVLAVAEDPDLKDKWFDLTFGNNRNVPNLIIYFKKTKIPLLKFLLKTIAYLKGYFYYKKRKKSFDLIHAHITIDAGFIAWGISFFSKTPYIITEQSTVFLENNLATLPKISIPLIKAALNKSKIILPVSHYLENNLKRLGVETSFHIIPNIVNTDLFTPIAKSNLKPKTFKFIHISAFQDFKNVPGILLAVKELSKKRTDFSMLIVGAGDLLALKKIKKELGIPDGILQLKGRMTENNIAETMQKQDCFVLFSDVETFGIVVAEALAVGIPVIATEVPCVVEILDEGNLGIIIPIKDVDALINAMDFMIDHPDYFAPEVLRKKVVECYSKEAIKKQLLKAYQKVIG